MNWPEDYIDNIISGDCLEVMGGIPDASIDLIVTDPPYGLNYNDGDLAHQREKAFGGNVGRMEARPIAGDGAGAVELFEAMLVEAQRVLRPSCCCCCCCGGGGPKPIFAEWTLLMDKHLSFKQAVVWDKGGLGMGIHYRRNYEFMLVAQKPGGGPCIWNGGKTTPNVFRLNKIIPSAKQHPTEKPVGLMEHFIRLHSNPGDVVLDPFLGHGATAIAAKQLDRRFIGIEISHEYCEIARERVRNTTPPLFVEEKEGLR